MWGSGPSQSPDHDLKRTSSNAKDMFVDIFLLNIFFPEVGKKKKSVNM